VGPGSPEDPLATASGADGFIASSLLDYGAEAFDRAPRLRVVARTGIGVDRIDIAEATRRSIVVCNAPDAPTVSTAEHAVALLLAVAKRLKASEARLRAGAGDYFSAHEALELEGRCLGVVGFGRIGRRVAALAQAFGMEFKVYDPYVGAARLGADGVPSMSDLLAAADAVTLHLPLTDETHHIIDATALRVLRPDAILINTARGGLVDHDSLLTALEAGRLGGAGLDVTDPEPLPPGHQLLQRDDVIVTPHVAAATGAGKQRLYVSAIRQALDVLDGRRPEHPVNPEVLATAPDRKGV
jgi:D-3-phosphoglycerate dehydrogenase